MPTMKVRGGTPVHGENLCLSCQSASRRQGHRVSEEEIYCHVFAAGEGAARVPYPIAACSSYRDVRLERPAAFYKTGWVFIPAVGKFVSPDEAYILKQKGQLAHDPY